MSDEQLTAVEIINETVAYYSEDTSRRGITYTGFGDLKCVYITAGGQMCAVGRCLIEADKAGYG